jgi:replication factor C large subunit
MIMNFVEKYYPKGVGDLIGLDEQVKKVNYFLDNFKKVKKKALLLVGPEGSGKTCSVYAIADSKGYEVVEINASDKRNAENIKNIVGAASKQATLFAKPKIILIDEVDSLHGNLDRGGVKEINKVVKETRFPIIMTANDEYSKKIKAIKPSVSVVRFKRRGYWDVYKLLKVLNEREGKGLSLTSLKKLASLSQGDVRSGFNDLQNVSSDEEVEDLYERAKEINIFDVMKIVFKSKSFESLITSLDRFQSMDLRDVLLWIAENIVNEYEKPSEVREAYDWISRADVFLGRIRRRQYWRFLYYSKLLFTIGVGLSKDEMYKKWSRYQSPVKIKKMFKTVKARNELKALATEIGDLTHCSTNKALTEYAHHYRLWLA